MKTAILLSLFVASALLSYHQRSYHVLHSVYHHPETVSPIFVLCHCPVVLSRRSRGRCTSRCYLPLLLLLLSGDVEPNPGPDAHPSNPCQSCGKINARKRTIQCKHCSEYWHLSCVRMTRAQADALPQWWCQYCMNDDGFLDPPAILDQPRGELRALETNSAQDIAGTLAELKRSTRVIPRIPKGARIQAAEALTTLIDSALASESIASWSRLLKFPLVALALPVSGSSASDGLSLPTKIKRRITEYII